MPNDAKLGLVVGVSLVIAVAVIFFRRDMSDPASTKDPSAAITRSVALPHPSANGLRTVPGRFITRTEEGEGNE